MAEGCYRSAVVGLGVMGHIADGLGGRHPLWFRPCCHADAYEDHPKTELVAGATRNQDRQEKFRSERNLPVFADYHEMLAQVRPDFVSVATPATVHADVVLASAEEGVKGIWCEKAMGVSLAECDQMIEACDRAGTVLTINHQRRWDDQYRAVKRAISKGAIGELQMIQIHGGGGRLCRSGSHLFDLVRLFTGDEMAWGIGWLSNPGEFDPGGTGIFETTAGVRVIVDTATGMSHGLWIELVGNGGIIKVIDDGFEVQLWTPDDRSEMSEFGLLGKHHLPRNHRVSNPFLNAVDDMIRCIEQGGEPLSSGRDGRAAFEMIASVHLSHSGGKSVVPFPLQDCDLEIPSN